MESRHRIHTILHPQYRMYCKCADLNVLFPKKIFKEELFQISQNYSFLNISLYGVAPHDILYTDYI